MPMSYCGSIFELEVNRDNSRENRVSVGRVTDRAIATPKRRQVIKEVANSKIRIFLMPISMVEE